MNAVSKLGALFLRLLRNVISVVISWPIAMSSTTLKIRRYLSRNVNQREGPVVFVPYTSVDCLALHRGIGISLVLSGWRCKLLSLRGFSLDVTTHIRTDSIAAGTPEIDMSLVSQELESKGCSHLRHAIVDTAIHLMEANQLLTRVIVDRTIGQRISKKWQKALTLARSASAIVLPDSAYLGNQILKSAFFEIGRPVFTVNPDGTFRRLSKPQYSEYSVTPESLRSFAANSSRSPNVVDDYVTARFSGTARTDLDSGSAFRPRRNARVRQTRKVLFLHAFRDANNLTWEDSLPFQSFVQWADASLGHIAKNDPDSWYIKGHPMAHVYADDVAVLQELMHKHGLPQHLLELCPPTTEILAAKMPIYTNTGTIVLETLAHGYKSFFVGPRFAPSLGVRASTRSEWFSFLSLSTANAIVASSSEVKISPNIARLMIYRDFGYRPIAGICPTRKVFRGATSREKLAAGVSQLANSLRDNALVGKSPARSTAVSPVEH